MKYLTWNVNGLRAIVSKGFEEQINVINPDIIGVQEVKMSAELPQIELSGYYAYYNHGTRPVGINMRGYIACFQIWIFIHYNNAFSCTFINCVK